MLAARGERNAATDTERSRRNRPPEETTPMMIQVTQTTRKGRTTIRIAATPKSAQTQALLAEFKKGVKAIEKKGKAHAAAARKKAAKPRRRRR